MTFVPSLPKLDYSGECPKCGGHDGYYLKIVESHRYCYTWADEGDGEAEVVAGFKGGTRRYCQNCHKDVGPEV